MIGMEKIQHYEEELTHRLIDGLAQIKHVHVYAPSITQSPASVLSRSLLMECIRMKLPSSLMRPLISWCDPDITAASRLPTISNYLKVRCGRALHFTTPNHEIDMLLATLEELTR